MPIRADDTRQQRPGAARACADLHDRHAWLNVQQAQHGVNRGVGGDLRNHLAILGCGPRVMGDRDRRSVRASVSVDRNHSSISITVSHAPSSCR